MLDILFTLTDLGSIYKTVVRQEKSSNSRFGFTLQGKFYEIDETEHLKLIQSNQGLVIFHLLIKHRAYAEKDPPLNTLTFAGRTAYLQVV